MKFSLRSECQFDASCFVDTLTIQVKYVRFQFSIRDMGKDIPVQPGDRNRRIFVSEKIVSFGWKSPVFKLNIQCERKLYVNFFKDILENLSSFPVFNYNNTYGEYHPNRGFTMDTSLVKIMVIFCSKMFFEAFFQDEDHLYANCLFYNLTIYRQYFFFQFLSLGIRMHIPILTEVQNRRITTWQNIIHILKLIFQDEGHLCTNCLFYILTI